MLNLKNIYDALLSHAKATKLFDSVQASDPDNDLNAKSIACGVVLRDVNVHSGRSGLSSTSVRVDFDIVVFGHADIKPADSVDLKLANACDKLLERLIDDLTLNGSVANIDIQGEAGNVIGVQAGYFESNGPTYRVFTISLGVIVNDAYTHGV